MREGWEQSELSNIAEVVMGQSPPGTSYNSVGSGMPFIQGSAEFGAIHPSPVKWCTDPRKIAEPGDVLFSVRAPVGDLNVANQRIAIGRGLSIIRGTDGKASTSFLALALSFGASEIAKRSSTGMFTSITGAQLKSLPIALPPLDEQRRIVDLMDSVDAAISTAQAEVDAAEELRKRVLGHELGSPGEGWEATSIGDAIQVNPKMGKLDASAPFVTMSDVDEWGTYAYPSGKKGSRGGIRAQGGDVLFARITPCLENGKIGKLPDAAPPTGGSTEFIVLRGTEKATSDFAFLLAQSDYVHSSAVALMTGSTGRQRVAASDVANIPINLPPLHEQCRIVETMNTLDGTVDASRASLDRLRELRSSMLSVLLSGEHEIPATYDQFLGLSDDERAG